MASFRQILTASEEDLLKIFYAYLAGKSGASGDIKLIAKELSLRAAQLVCAIGFNPHINKATELLPAIGYQSLDTLKKDRNTVYINDVYKRVALDNILTLYGFVKDYPEILEEIQSMLEQRLAKIEEKIEASVNSIIIDRYKEEMRSIYIDGIADLDFAERRLNQYESGFRALINEVYIIIESRLIPAGDIFFRNSILPEEKRRLVNKGLIPDDLIEARLKDADISKREKQMLEEYLEQTKHNKN
ncbi:MAG TPA: hypothetical protein VIV20_05755 [Gammaproteobacteria bacterium]